jgi:hypothetical protein
MRFLMLVCAEREAGGGPAGHGRPVGPAPHELGVEEWTAQMDGRGVRLLGEVTRPGGDAVAVRVRDGKVLCADGAYADTGDVILGFDVLDCAGPEEAVEIAARHPMARDGVLELRQFWEE